MSDPRAPEEPDLDLARKAGRRAERRAHWLAHGERSLGQNLAMIGALGWMITVPTLLAMFLGRWVDRRFGTGVSWTGALLVVGVTLGCWVAWRRIQEIMHEDEE